MKRILNFREYTLNESESFDGYSDFLELPDKIKKLLKNNTSKNRFAKVLGPNFSIRLQDNRLHFIFQDKNIQFPFIKVIEGNPIADLETINDPNNYKKFERDLFGDDNRAKTEWSVDDIMEKLSGKTKSWTLKYKLSIESLIARYISDIIDVIYLELSRIKENFLNPFDTNLESNESIRILNKMGVSIVSSNTQKKNGTLVFSAQFLDNDIAIHSNGYIRRISDRTSLMTTNIQLTRPIVTEDDLNLKLTYVIVYCIKTILKNSGTSNKQIAEVGKSFTNGDFKPYNELILSVVKDNPEVAHILPDPDNIISQTLKRGSGILSRFGNIFDM